MQATKPLGWAGIARLGLVQSALGALVALTTSTLNRVMVVELALPAMLPAALVAFHYAIQISRPRWGYGSDMGHRRTPWIIGGMAVLALGVLLATDAALLIPSNPVIGVLLSVVAYAMIGGGVGAAGTSLLALLATRVAPERRPAAAAMTWIMMILGIVVSSIAVGALIQPFTVQVLALTASGVALVAFLVTLLAVWGVEPEPERQTTPESAVISPDPVQKPSFSVVLREIWAEPMARRFSIFVFVSMLAYSAQDLILEPFAGLVFGLTPGQSTQMSGMQHAGVLLGMIVLGIIGSRSAPGKRIWMRQWTIVGCVGSALALGGLGMAALTGPGWPLAPTVFALGVANGIFAVAAIGSMMGLAGEGQGSREGIRMGLWGASQAIAFGLGGFLGAVGVDVLRTVFANQAHAFLVVFAVEAALFIGAAIIAARLDLARAVAPQGTPSSQDTLGVPAPAGGL